MKTATLPALRVDPALRQAAERALRPHETLSKLMEASLTRFIEQRQAEDDFVARALESREEARRSGEVSSARAVVSELERKLERARVSSTNRSADAARPRIGGRAGKAKVRATRV